MQIKKTLKGTRWILLKNTENLKDDNDEKRRLLAAIKLNEPLAMAYYLKEELKQIWRQESRKEAQKVLGKWIATAKSSGIKILEKFAETLLNHRDGILNWYEHNISTGPLEGLNNKIKVMKRLALWI